MAVELLDTEAAAWSAMLERARHDFYHLPAYVALAAQHEGGRACALWIEGDEGELLLPLLERAIAGTDLRDVATPYGYPGPLFSSADERQQAALLRRHWSEVAERLRARGVVSLFARLHPLLPAPLEALAQQGALVAHGQTVSLDLTRPEEAQWQDMRATTRNELRRAQKAGVQAQRDVDFAQLTNFGALYRDSMARLGAAVHVRFSDSYFAALRAALGDRLSLWTVSHEGGLIAGALFTEVGGLVQYHLSASDRRHQKQQPMKTILDSVRRWAQARGDTVMHLGGGVGGAEDSLFFFKAGFSSARHTFRTWRVVLDEEAYARLVPGPRDLGGFFPAYRRVAS